MAMHSRLRGAAVLIGLGAACSGALAQGPNSGPDVIVGDLYNTNHYGSIGNIHAYSVGTESCNAGDFRLNWISNTNQHPVIAQNIYRLSGGRFEHLGQSWLKHGFFALQGGLCFPCQATSSSFLGPGCSDPYGAGLNGSQSGLGPRFEVNAATGFYPYPFSNPAGSTGDAIFKRIQVLESDMTTPGAQYYIEGQYISPDDAAAGNKNNNASYRPIRVNDNMSLTLLETTKRELPAIFAWVGADPQVKLRSVDVENDGRFWVGTRASSNPDGTWHYEYAVHNLNSHRSGGSFSIGLPANATVTNIGFHDVPYHSGEPFDGTDWTATVSSDSITWATQTFAQNQNANALRWGTLYNFRFDADVAPTTGDATIGLFRPGAPATATAMLLPVPDTTVDCVVDFAAPFGTLDFFDAQEFLALFDAEDPASDLAAPFGVWDFFDVQEFLSLFDAGCP